MVNFHHVNHSGANRKYYLAVLKHIKENPSYGVNVTISNLSEFIREGAPDGTDVLSYQTFPDETNTKKFNPRVIQQSDFRFHTFKGRKVLVDLHDSGDRSSYTRMMTTSHLLPKVKCFPSIRFLACNNIVMVSTVSANPGAFPDECRRTIDISCKFGSKRDWFYGHPIRAIVTRYLEESFKEYTDFNWVPTRKEYNEELKRTRIVIGAPGWGEYNQSYWGALKSGCLLFAHCALNDIKLFPHSDLVDGEDFISYNLYNFKDKLGRVLHNPKEFDRIRNNGRRKFEQGLDHEKSAKQLIKFIKGESS